MGIQFRPGSPGNRNAGAPLYQPERDVAYITPTLMRHAILQLEPEQQRAEVRDWLAQHNVDPSMLGNAIVALAKSQALYVSHDTRVASPAEALGRSGFFDFPYSIRSVISSAIGESLIGFWFQGVRDVTPAMGDAPVHTQLCELLVASRSVARALADSPPEPPADLVELDALRLSRTNNRIQIEQLEAAIVSLQAALAQEVAAHKSLQTLGFWGTYGTGGIMDLSALAGSLRHWFGDNIPTSYTVIDIETSGFSNAYDVIVDVGWAVVRNRKIIDRGGTVLNWQHHPVQNWDWVCQRMAKTKQGMAAKGRNYPYTPERLLTGLPANTVLGEFADLLTDILDRRELLVGYNAWQFERQKIDSVLWRFLGRKLPWHDEAIFDVGLLIKAARLGRIPWVGETRESWFKRVASPPFNVTWALDSYLIPAWQMQSRHGLDPAASHDAETDAAACYYAMEDCHDIADGVFSRPASIGRFMANILALDPATHCGFAFAGSIRGVWISGVWDLSVRKDESAGMRLIRLRSKLAELHRASPIDLLVYEASRNLQHGAAVRVAGAIQGQIEVFCTDANIAYRGYSPAEIKKFATGKGNAGKPAMMAAAAARWPDRTFIDDNEVDAVFLAELAAAEYVDALPAATLRQRSRMSQQPNDSDKGSTQL